MAAQLQVALNSRVIIEQVKGVLAERLRGNPDEAFVIRRHARDHNHSLTQLSADVIHGTARIPGARRPGYDGGRLLSASGGAAADQPHGRGDQQH